MNALPAIDQAVIRPAHLTLALHCSEALIARHIAAGNIPRPDARGLGNVKLWKRSTIRAWNPTIADAIDDLLKHPAFAPRPDYFAKAT
jgi:hypothetical protein